MPKLLFHGSLDAIPDATDLSASLPSGLGLKPKLSGQIRIARAGTPPHQIEVQDDDVVELDLGDGLRLWTSGAQLRRDIGPAAAREAGGEAELPTTLQLGSPSRGVGSWVIKGLKIFGVDVAGSIAEFVTDKVEGKLDPSPGLYRCRSSPVTPLEAMGRGDKLNGGDPVLVFIHGTASSTQSSFGALWEGAGKARIARVFEAYAEGQVLAFQHRTLSESPIENALELAQALAEKLPAGARLHLVSHSRGGMVGELLCRGMAEGRLPFDDSDLKRFSAPERERDRRALEALSALLAKTPLRVERFVRVACPARGTTLADGRLDRYLSMLLNLLGATGLKASPVYDGLATLLLGVIKKRTEPQELPGLEAMIPVSPLVSLLNRPDVRTRADLHVLGGDIEGSGLLGRLKVLATDLYYREDHDLVVNTPAMFGGAPRADGIRYWIDQGAAVNHFNYFRNDDTAERLVAALAQPERADFHALEAKPSEITEDDYRKRAAGPQPIVFVLPGIMGSHLKVGEDRVWLDFLDLAAGGLARLAIDAAGVTAEKPLGDGYGALIRFLAQSHEVVPFAYDWRQPLDVLAEGLRKRIEQALPAAESTKQPIRIIAHSMGGLVVRAMLATADGQATWQRICKHPGARFLMLGTPNGGSHSIAGLLLGRDALVRKLAMLDLRHDYGELLQIISRYPGVMALLPDRASGTGTLDLFDPAVWQRLRQHDVDAARGLFSSSAASEKSSGVQWPLPDPALLAQARSGRQEVKQVRLDAERMLYVAGCAPSTPVDIVIDEAAPPGRRVIVKATEHGDGRVPWETGIPSELSRRTWYLDAAHGDMAAQEDAFPALLDLLNLGTTKKLAQTPPARRSRADETVILPPEALEMFPDEADLTAAALGGSGRAKRRKPSRKVRVQIVQGNLAHARHPVAVGHYRGDTIVSAESYLDRVLDGRLRERHRLGLYPGPINSSAVFLGEDAGARTGSNHPGAVVVGLGDVGDLTPGSLMSGFAQAAVMYAAELLDCRRRQSQPMPADGIVTAPLTTLLIGTGAGGFGLADSILSILRGVVQANRRLEGLNTREKEEASQPAALRTAWINQIDIIELYEDRAIQALKALLELAGAAEFRDAFEIEELLVESEGGRRRAYFEEDPAWWQRLRIEAQEDGSLRFEALTGRARVETNLQSTQRRLVERFLDDAVATTATDAELSYTLFEMLLPNRLKERAPDRRNVVLVLDPGAAAYPWELLHDRHDAGSRPLAVEAGMVRQLTVAQFRERVQGATDNRALVVGDPKNTDRRFPPLPGAQNEAREVAKQLRGAGYQEVLTLIGDDATPRAVLTALHAKPYRVLHLAAHGVFEFELDDDGGGAATPAPGRKKNTVSGMALGDGVFLTPAEVEQLRFVPDLVFINCCHLGQARSETAVQFHRLAANLATQFIRLGVRGVVAAGWAVDDAAAMTFAQAFYEKFLRGRAFGEAVREAREEVYLKHRSANTWGAYQCYGDPDFSLAAGGRTPSSGGEHRIVSSAELRVELENIAQAVGSASDSGRKGLRERLMQVVKAMPQPWLRSAATRSALGKAYAELGMFEEAIGHYEAAMGLESADARLSAVEQLANLRARWAVRVAEKDAGRARELFKTAETEIERLIQIGATPERFAIKGSLGKRRAMTATSDAERKKALRQMADAYHDAYKEASRPDSANFRGEDSYPLQNWLVAEIILGWAEPRARLSKEQESGLRKLSELARTLPQENPNFWNLCLAADVQLLEHLSKQKLGTDAIQEIVRGYQSAARRGGSPGELGSTADHVEFIQKMATHLAEASKRESLVKDLAAIRTGISD